MGDRPRSNSEDIVAPVRRVKRRPRKRSTQRWRKIAGFLLFFAVIVLGYTGYLCWRSPIIRCMFAFPSVSKEFPGVQSINVLMVGHDDDYDNKDRVLKSKARSDMLMGGKFDFENKTIHLLSIPRDTEAKIPGHGYRKINVAFAIGGSVLSAQTISDNFGIPIDHSIALNFDAFKQSIDILHGVNLTVDRKMDYDDNWGHLHIHLLPGSQHLNGDQAMGFVRFRHADTDEIRTKRQQCLIAALKQKAISPEIFIQTPKIVETIDKNVMSDLTDKQKLALASFARSLPKSSIDMETMPSDNVGNKVYTNIANATPILQKWFGVTPPDRLAKNRHQHQSVRLIASNTP